MTVLPPEVEAAPAASGGAGTDVLPPEVEAAPISSGAPAHKPGLAGVQHEPNCG